MYMYSLCTVDRITCEVRFNLTAVWILCLFWYSVTFVALQAQDNIMLCYCVKS